MAHWDDDEYWDDADEPPPCRRAWRALEDDDTGTAELPPLLRPLEHELEGSIYDIADRLWGFEVADRDWHPGACARCDVSARIAFCHKGIDASRARLDRFPALIVEPTAQNGLEKRTAFMLEPRRI